MQSVSSRIWTRVAVSISYDDNDYTTGISSKFWNDNGGKQDVAWDSEFMYNEGIFIIFEFSISSDT